MTSGRVLRGGGGLFEGRKGAGDYCEFHCFVLIDLPPPPHHGSVPGVSSEELFCRGRSAEFGRGCLHPGGVAGSASERSAWAVGVGGTGGAGGQGEVGLEEVSTGRNSSASHFVYMQSEPESGGLRGAL